MSGESLTDNKALDPKRVINHKSAKARKLEKLNARFELLGDKSQRNLFSLSSFKT